MKKSEICFFMLTAVLTAALLAGAWLWFRSPRQAEPIPGQMLETETAPEDNMVINQSNVERMEEEKNYCLAAEDGFLYVFAKDREKICLDTHMPLAEFPAEEQEKLMEGIWFSNMMEIFSYLESYTS